MLFNALKAILASVNLKVVRVSLQQRGTDLEVDLKRFFKTKPPTILFDIGANVGQTAQRFASFYSSADIYAFEPIQATYQILLSRTAKNPRIHCHCVALGEKSVEVEMRIGTNSQGSRRTYPDNSDQGGPREKVQMLQLDDFCEQHDISRIDLLKTDCEGYDLEVLLGARRLLSEGQIDVIYCEVNFLRDKRHADFFEVESYLYGLGYMFYGLYEYFGDWVGSSTNALFVRKDFWEANNSRG
jgi:FkbM family methyltransferase